MNEREMAATLGLLNEPIKNRVKLDPVIENEIHYLKYIFSVVENQKRDYGPVNPDIWVEFVPWHSLN